MLTDCLAACAHLTITISELERDIGENNGRKARFFIPPLHSTPLLGGFPSEYRYPFGMEKLEWCLPDGEKISKIRLFVLSTNVTDGRTDRQTDDGQTLHDSKDRAYASHRAVKIAVFTYHSPHFCFPWRRPCDYHAICCMDGKTIQCLPNPSQHVPIYLQ